MVIKCWNDFNGKQNDKFRLSYVLERKSYGVYHTLMIECLKDSNDDIIFYTHHAKKDALKNMCKKLRSFGFDFKYSSDIIEQSHLSVRAKNVLKMNGIHLLSQLKAVNKDVIRQFYGIGTVTYNEILNYMEGK